MKKITLFIVSCLFAQVSLANPTNVLCRLPNTSQGPEVNFEIIDNRIKIAVYSQKGYFGKDVIANLPCEYELNSPQVDGQNTVVSCTDGKEPGYIIEMVSGPMGLNLRAEIYETKLGVPSSKQLTLACEN